MVEPKTAGLWTRGRSAGVQLQHRPPQIFRPYILLLLLNYDQSYIGTKQTLNFPK